jgi:anthranilate/para-aminobenzoate synthase component II
MEMQQWVRVTGKNITHQQAMTHQQTQPIVKHTQMLSGIQDVAKIGSTHTWVLNQTAEELHLKKLHVIGKSCVKTY